MKTLLLLCLPLLLTGCFTTGSTILFSPNTGARLAQFPADMDESEYRGGGVYWKVRGHRPSTTIAARGKAYTMVIKAKGQVLEQGAQAFSGGVTGIPR